MRLTAELLYRTGRSEDRFVFEREGGGRVVFTASALDGSVYQAIAANVCHAGKQIGEGGFAGDLAGEDTSCKLKSCSNNHVLLSEIVLALGNRRRHRLPSRANPPKLTDSSHPIPSSPREKRVNARV